MPIDHAPYWNKDFPSYLLVTAMGAKPDQSATTAPL